MTEYTSKDAIKHARRLAETAGQEYIKVRELWDARSIDYFWAMLERIGQLESRQSEWAIYTKRLWLKRKKKYPD